MLIWYSWETKVLRLNLISQLLQVRYWNIFKFRMDVKGQNKLFCNKKKYKIHCLNEILMNEKCSAYKGGKYIR